MNIVHQGSKFVRYACTCGEMFFVKVGKRVATCPRCGLSETVKEKEYER